VRAITSHLPGFIRRVAVAGLLCGLLHSPAARAETPPPAIHLRGSLTLMPIAQQVAERYMREHAGVRIVLSGGGTYRGYKTLLEGTADIAMTSSAPSDELLTLRTQDSPTFVTTPIGFVALAPIVHPSNAVQSLKMTQLHDVFIGRIDNLKQIGGKNGPITVLIGAPIEGITESWRQMVVTDEAHYTPKAMILNVKERVNRVAADPGAVSFVSLDDVDGRVKALALDGVTADEENIRNGRYTLVTTLSLVTTEHASAPVKELISYFLTASRDLHMRGFIAAPAPASAAKP
jgi:phosphate transport system substrate-binding protein